MYLNMDTTFVRFALAALEDDAGGDRYLLGSSEHGAGNLEIGPASARAIVEHLRAREEQRWPSLRMDRQAWYDDRWRKPPHGRPPPVPAAVAVAERLRGTPLRQRRKMLTAFKRPALLGLAASLLNTTVEEQTAAHKRIPLATLRRMLCVQLDADLEAAYSLLAKVPPAYYEICWEMTFSKYTSRGDASLASWSPPDAGAAFLFEVAHPAPFEYAYSLWKLAGEAPRVQHAPPPK